MENIFNINLIAENKYEMSSLINELNSQIKKSKELKQKIKEDLCHIRNINIYCSKLKSQINILEKQKLF